MMTVVTDDSSRALLEAAPLDRRHTSGIGSDRERISKGETANGGGGPDRERIRQGQVLGGARQSLSAVGRVASRVRAPSFSVPKIRSPSFMLRKDEDENKDDEVSPWGVGTAVVVASTSRNAESSVLLGEQSASSTAGCPKRSATGENLVVTKDVAVSMQACQTPERRKAHDRTSIDSKDIGNVVSPVSDSGVSGASSPGEANSATQPQQRIRKSRVLFGGIGGRQRQDESVLCSTSSKGDTETGTQKRTKSKRESRVLFAVPGKSAVDDTEADKPGDESLKASSRFLHFSKGKKEHKDDDGSGEKAGLSKSKSTRPDVSKSKSTKPDLSKSKSTKPDVSKRKTTKSDLSKSKSTKPELSKSKSVWFGNRGKKGEEIEKCSLEDDPKKASDTLKSIGPDFVAKAAAQKSELIKSLGTKLRTEDVHDLNSKTLDDEFAKLEEEADQDVDYKTAVRSMAQDDFISYQTKKEKKFKDKGATKAATKKRGTPGSK